MTVFSNGELERVWKEYSRRDALGLSKIYIYTNPAYLFHIQEREWAILQLLKKEGIELKNLSVLDVGCGAGHVLHRFVEFGARNVTGIDLMRSRIQTAKERYPHLRLVQGNAAQLPYREESFDLVMQFMCLSSIRDPSMREQIADEMWRVLRPGGSILFYDLRPRPLVTRLLFRLFSLLSRILRLVTRNRRKILFSGEGGSSTPIKPLSLKEVKELYKKDPICWRLVSLDFNLCELAGKSHFLTHLLSRILFLRTHYLVFFRKVSIGSL